MSYDIEYKKVPNTGSSLLDDIGDFVTDPQNWLRAVSLMGWTGILTDMLPGALRILAEATVHTMPGLVHGDSFSDAFIKEYSWRLKQAAEAFGADFADQQLNQGLKSITTDTVLGNEIKEGVQRVKDAYPDLDTMGALQKAGLDPEKLAAERGLRPDVWAQALNYFLHEKLFELTDFDLQSGKRIVTRKFPSTTTSSTPATITADEAYRKWQDAIKAGRPAVIITALKAQYEKAQALLDDMGIRTNTLLSRIPQGSTYAVGPTGIVSNKILDASPSISVLTRAPSVNTVQPPAGTVTPIVPVATVPFGDGQPAPSNAESVAKTALTYGLPLLLGVLLYRKFAH